MSAYSDLILAHASLVAYWRLGEASGTFVDSEGANDSLTVGAGVTYGVTGALTNDADKAVTFDGTNNGIEVLDDASLDLGDVVSVEFWVKRSATQGANQGIVSKSPGVPSTGAYQVRFSVGNRIQFTGSAGGVMLSSSVLTDTASWHHVVATKNGSTRNMYVDGVLDNSIVGTNQTLGNNNGNLFIGQSGSAAERFPGSVDEVALYSTAITADEVLQHYRLGRGLVAPVTETDSAQALDKDKAATLTTASETDSAQALSYAKPIYKTLTPATESNAAEALDADKAASLTSADETDSAQALSISHPIYRTITPAVETDEAQALTIQSTTQEGGGWVDMSRRVIRPKKPEPQAVLILPAEEHDAAMPLTYRKTPSRIQIEDDELLLLV